MSVRTNRSFSRADVELILRTALGDEAFEVLGPLAVKFAVAGLQGAKEVYTLSRYGAAQPSPSKLCKRLRAVSSASRRLLNVLGADLRDPHPRKRGRFDAGQGIAHDLNQALAGKSGEWMAVRHAAASVRELMVRADAAEKVTAASVRRDTHDRHSGDVALNAFLGAAIEMWRGLGLRPSVSTDPITGQPGGPFFKFARFCVDRIGEAQTDQALVKRLQRLDGLGRNRT